MQKPPQRQAARAAAITGQLTDLWFAVPAVVAHRVARMANAGATPSPRDRKEFQGMVAEKAVAFGASWQAMALQTARANQAMAATWLRLWCTPALWGGSAAHTLQNQAMGAAMGVLGKGLAPVRSKAVANARRLATVSVLAPRARTR